MLFAVSQRGPKRPCRPPHQFLELNSDVFAVENAFGSVLNRLADLVFPRALRPPLELDDVARALDVADFNVMTDPLVAQNLFDPALDVTVNRLGRGWPLRRSCRRWRRGLGFLN